MIGTLLHYGGQHGGAQVISRYRALAKPQVIPFGVPPQVGRGTDPFDVLAGWTSPDHIDFLYGNMLANGFVTLLGAAGGVGKSALMVGVAASCSLGVGLLGEPVARRLRVLSINLEDSRRKVRRGFKAFIQHHGLNSARLNGWCFTAGVDDVARALPGGLRLIIVDPTTRREILNEQAMSWLRHAVTSRSIDVLMLDPFSRLIRGNENAVEVVDQLMERLALLATETSTAILIAQHVRKAGGGIASDGAAALRGSSAVSDGARNAYGLHKPTAAECVQNGILVPEGFMVMTHIKGNLSYSDLPSYLRIVGVRLPGGNPAKDPPQVERGRWAPAVERYTPQPISQSITPPMFNAVMTAIAAQARDARGVRVPFAPVAGRGKGRTARNPVPVAAAALQAVKIGLATDRAEQLAIEVIKEAIRLGSGPTNHLPRLGAA